MVSMPLQLYRDVRNKCLTCDTLIDNYDSILLKKDSIIVEYEKKEVEYNKIITSKDTTIQSLKFEVKELANSKECKFYQKKETWIIALISFALGVVLSK
jgi:hypothetical protein